MATATKESPPDTKTILLSDNVRIYPGPEFESVQRLDRVRIVDAWGDNALTVQLTAWNVTTFADLRKLVSTGGKVLKGLPNWKSSSARIEWRLSSKILCDCGQPFMLHRMHVTCERPNCVAFHHVLDVDKLRNAFPDQISHTRGE